MLDLKFRRILIHGFEIGKNKLLRHHAFPSAQTYILLGSVQNKVDAPLTVSQGIGSSLFNKKIKMEYHRQ